MIATVWLPQLWIAQEHLFRAQGLAVAQERAGASKYVLEEYVRVQEDLEAYLNPPCGTLITDRFWETVRYLENRLDALELQLLEPTA